MRLFDRRVRRAVKDLVRQGARVRVLDGKHLMLLPPGPEGATMKVSASRQPTSTLYYIRHQFAEPNGLDA
jgi:hypothetical protein